MDIAILIVLCVIFAMLNDRLTKILNQLIKLNASTEDRSKEQNGRTS